MGRAWHVEGESKPGGRRMVGRGEVSTDHAVVQVRGNSGLEYLRGLSFPTFPSLIDPLGRIFFKTNIYSVLRTLLLSTCTLYFSSVGDCLPH